MLLVSVLGACKTAPPASGCSLLIRPILSKATPHATLNDSGDEAQDWREYGIAETGQLNKANDDKTVSLAIIEACERRDAEVKRLIDRPWWALW